jgi:hypothetical protein
MVFDTLNPHYFSPGIKQKKGSAKKESTA